MVTIQVKKIIYTLIIIFAVSNASLHSMFRFYEELPTHGVHIRTKREAVTGRFLSKFVSFSALGRLFRLRLFTDLSILSPEFEVHTIDENGSKNKIDVRTDNIFSGYDEGDMDSQVAAVQTEDLWYIHLWTSKDTFVVEPLQRLDPQKKKDILLVYNAKDILTNMTKKNINKNQLCKTVDLNGVENSPDWDKYFADDRLFGLDSDIEEMRQSDIRLSKTNEYQNEHSSDAEYDIFRNLKNDERHNDVLDDHIDQNVIKKVNAESSSLDIENVNTTEYGNRDSNNGLTRRRSTTSQSFRRPRGDRHSGALNTCEILAIIDYEAFKRVGKRSVDAIVSWITNVYQGVDRLLLNSGLEEGGLQYGVKLRKVIIFAEYTKVKAGERHFNMANNILTDEETLYAMTKYRKFVDFCLAHLTTSRIFSSGVLGMASIASPDATDFTNGICSATKLSARNIGFSTTVDTDGNRLPSGSYIPVIAHEIGHNFGAYHDPEDDKQCSPSSKDGGKYLMWKYSGSPLDQNSARFSPCSLKQLSLVMKSKAHKCFRTRASLKNYCGDGLVSPAEDCDPGFVDGKEDNCCASNCRFKAGAKCSPLNHPCCTSICQPSPAGYRCIANISNSCAGPSFCQENDAFSCIQSSPLPNGTPCPGSGSCWSGRCASYCEFLGRTSNPPRQLTTCSCDENPKMMCQLCCRDMSKVNGNSIPPCVSTGEKYGDGARCILGFCQEGTCLKGKGGDKIEKNKKTEKNDVNLVFTILVVTACVMVCVLAVILICLFLKQKKSRDTDIETLRKMLQDAIGHFNQSPDDDDNPTQDAIKRQLKQNA